MCTKYIENTSIICYTYRGYSPFLLNISNTFFVLQNFSHFMWSTPGFPEIRSSSRNQCNSRMKYWLLLSYNNWRLSCYTLQKYFCSRQDFIYRATNQMKYQTIINSLVFFLRRKTDVTCFMSTWIFNTTNDKW